MYNSKTDEQLKWDRKLDTRQPDERICDQVEHLEDSMDSKLTSLESQLKRIASKTEDATYWLAAILIVLAIHVFRHW